MQAGIRHSKEPNVKNFLERLMAISNHKDNIMLSTYGTTLLKVVWAVQRSPPDWKTARKLLSFNLRRKSHADDGGDTKEYTLSKLNQSCCVCERSLLNMTCHFQCGFKYHYDVERQSIVPTDGHLRSTMLT